MRNDLYKNPLKILLFASFYFISSGEIIPVNHHHNHHHHRFYFQTKYGVDIWAIQSNAYIDLTLHSQSFDWLRLCIFFCFKSCICNIQLVDHVSIISFHFILIVLLFKKKKKWFDDISHFFSLLIRFSLNSMIRFVIIIIY